MNLNIKLNKYRPRSRKFVMDTGYDDDTLAPVMPAIDVVQQLIEEESRQKSTTTKTQRPSSSGSNSLNLHDPQPGPSDQSSSTMLNTCPSDRSNSSADQVQQDYLKNTSQTTPKSSAPNSQDVELETPRTKEHPVKASPRPKMNESRQKDTSLTAVLEDEDQSFLVRNNPLLNLTINNSEHQSTKANKQDDYEFVPKSVILDVYSNDPEVKRVLRQLPKIFNESGYNEQDYKCYSCRRPVGIVFGQSRLCHFDGHHYCSECHLGEKSVIPSRILCNWDFNKYPVSKRNQHFLTLISNEPMFELRKASPRLYRVCAELREIEELRRQAFFVRSYCTTCVQDSISFELTKLIWPREHMIKQTDLYSLEDLIQIKNGTLKQVLKNVITFGKQHVLSCVLCCQKGFICEICKSSQIIYPFNTDSVHRCNECQSIYHKSCFESRGGGEESCPRCQRLKARRNCDN